MDVYWFWPYMRPEHLPLAAETPGPTDTLTIHSVPGRIGIADAPPRVTIDPTLADVQDRAEGTARWLASRATVYQRRVRQRRALVDTRHFDVVHTVFANYFTDGRALPRLAPRARLLTSVHDAVPHESRVPSPIERRLLARLYDHGGDLIVHHQSVGDQLVERFGVDRARIHDVPHWVLPMPFSIKEAPDPAPTILFFGALRRNKGVDVLLDSLRALHSARPDATVVVAGRGADDVEAAVRARAQTAPNLRSEIGYIEADRKHELYRQADIVVLPYTSFASQSGVLHDAYSHRRPVVVTDVGALGLSVRAEATGSVVQPFSPEALADAIVTLLASPDRWLNAAQAAGAVADARSPAATAAAFRAIYSKVG